MGILFASTAPCEDCAVRDRRVEAAERDAKETRRKLAMTAAQLVDAQASLAVYRAPAERIERLMHDLKHGFPDEDFPEWFMIGTRANPILTSQGDSARFSDLEEFAPKVVDG